MEIDIIDIDKEHLEKNQKYIKDKQTDDYDNFYKKESYKVSLINIDSSFRNQNPKNIYTSSNNYLPNNPITVSYNSSIITIDYPNHNLAVNDQIIIQNVSSYNYIVSGNIFLFNNFNYLVIKIKHYYNTNYVNLLVNPQINISLINQSNKTLYNNIPLNSIIGTFNIILPSIADLLKSIPTNILKLLNVSTSLELDNEYIFIKLPYDYHSLINPTYEITDYFKITFLDLNGIPLNGINANYPISYDKLQGFQQVYEIIDNKKYPIICSLIKEMLRDAEPQDKSGDS
jgi:hypothetical protein